MSVTHLHKQSNITIHLLGVTICFANIHKNGSTFNSKAEHGRFKSKDVITSGCKTPSTPTVAPAKTTCAHRPGKKVVSANKCYQSIISTQQEIVEVVLPSQGFNEYPVTPLGSNGISNSCITRSSIPWTNSKPGDLL